MVMLGGALLSLLLTLGGLWWSRRWLGRSATLQEFVCCAGAATVLGGVLAALETGWRDQAAAAVTVAAVIVLLLINLKSLLIPDALLFTIACAHIAIRWASPFELGHALISGVVAFIIPGVLLFFWRKAVGYGVLRVLGVLGLALLWPSVGQMELVATTLLAFHILHRLWTNLDPFGDKLPAMPYVAVATLLQMVIDARHLIDPDQQWRTTGTLLMILLVVIGLSRWWLIRQARAVAAANPPDPNEPFKIGATSPDRRWLAVFEDNHVCATFSIYEQGEGWQDAIRVYERISPPIHERNVRIWWARESTHALLLVDRQCWAVMDLGSGRKRASHLMGGIPWDQAERGVRANEGETMRFSPN